MSVKNELIESSAVQTIVSEVGLNLQRLADQIEGVDRILYPCCYKDRIPELVFP